MALSPVGSSLKTPFFKHEEAQYLVRRGFALRREYEREIKCERMGLWYG